jgi:hypothetical protein
VGSILFAGAVGSAGASLATASTSAVAAGVVTVPTVAGAVAGTALAAGSIYMAGNAARNLGKDVSGKNVQSGSEAKASQPYKRPSNATTKAQRESVQGKPCVDCGRRLKKCWQITSSH